MEKSYEPSNFASLAFQVRILATAHDVITSTQTIFDRLLAWIPLASPASVVEDGTVWLVSRMEYTAQIVSIQRGNPFIRFHSRKKKGKDNKLGSGLCEDIGQSGAAPTRLFFTLTISMRAALRRIRKPLPNLQ